IRRQLADNGVDHAANVLLLAAVGERLLGLELGERLGPELVQLGLGHGTDVLGPTRGRGGRGAGGQAAGDRGGQQQGLQRAHWASFPEGGWYGGSVVFPRSCRSGVSRDPALPYPSVGNAARAKSTRPAGVAGNSPLSRAASTWRRRCSRPLPLAIWIARPGRALSSRIIGPRSRSSTKSTPM